MDVYWHFFKGIMGGSYQTANAVIRSNAVILSNAVESVYFLCNKNFIGPLAFAKSLLIYSKTGAIFFNFENILLQFLFNKTYKLSWFVFKPSILFAPILYFFIIYHQWIFFTCYLGSKEGTNIVTASSSSGSYTTTLGLLKAHRQDKIKMPDSSDVISFFDSNLVLIIYFYHYLFYYLFLFLNYFQIHLYSQSSRKRTAQDDFWGTSFWEPMFIWSCGEGYHLTKNIKLIKKILLYWGIHLYKLYRCWNIFWRRQVLAAHGSGPV